MVQLNIPGQLSSMSLTYYLLRPTEASTLREKAKFKFDYRYLHGTEGLQLLTGLWHVCVPDRRFSCQLVIDVRIMRCGK